MKKIYIWSAIIILAIIGLTVLRSDRGDIRTIKIGAVLPLTGSQAHVGEGLRNAIELAKKDLPANGKYKYEVIYEDNQFDAKTAATVANKLISVDKVDVILDAYAPIGNAISPITEKNKIVHIGIAFDQKVAAGDYNFLLFMTPDTAARTFLEEMRTRGLRKLGIFHVNNSGIAAVYEAVKNAAPNYGISIVSDEMFQPGERDFRNIITKSAPSKADLYALFALSPELEVLARQLNEHQMHNQTTIVYFELTQDRSLFEGLWFVGYTKIDPAFEQEYKKAYRKDITFGVPNIYDAFNVVVRAAETYQGEGKPSPTYLADNIQHAPDTEGTLGTLRVNIEGVIDSSASVKMIRNGKLETLR